MSYALLGLALIKQIVFLIGGYIFIRAYYWPRTFLQVAPMDRPTRILVLFILLVLGTWYRYTTQMPILGVWGYLFKMKY